MTGRRTVRALARAGSVVAILAGLAVAVGSSPASATGFPVVPTVWSPIVFTPGTQFYPNGNSMAADGLGNLYAIEGSSLVRFNVASSVATDAAPSLNLECTEGLVADSVGDVYVAYYPSCTTPAAIAEVSPSGAVTPVTSVYEVGLLALSSTGALYADAYNGSETGIFLITGSGATFVGPTACGGVIGMAVAPDGSIYYSTSCGHIYHMVGGVSTDFYTGVGYYLGALAIDGLGNVYASDLDGYYSSPLVISPSGTPQVLSTPADAPYVAPYCDEGDGSWIQNSVVIGGPTLYAGFAYCEGDPPVFDVFSTTVTPQSAIGGPPMLGATTFDQTVSGVLGQTITATWNGVPGAVSYTCTLMYALGVPSSFTVTTPSRTCSFGFLDPATEFGVQVVANFTGGATSPPSSAFAAPPPLPPAPATVHKTTLVCEKNHTHRLKVVTAVDPRCGSGWHLVG